MSERPSVTHKRIIRFPYRTGNPVLEWRDTATMITAELNGQPAPPAEYHELKLEELNLNPDWKTNLEREGSGIVVYRSEEITTNPIRRRNLRPKEEGGISLRMRASDSLIINSHNRSLQACTDGKSQIHDWWRGDIVAISQSPVGWFEDITMADFRDIIDHITTFPTTHAPDHDVDSHLTQPFAIRGVRINCYGEAMRYGKDMKTEYVPVNVPLNHVVGLSYLHQQVSHVTQLWGMPIRLYQDPESTRQEAETGDEDPADNPNARPLMLQMNPDTGGWGQFDRLLYGRRIGNILAVREDKKDLKVEDVLKIRAFATERLEPLIERVRRKDDELTKRLLWYYITH
ncbi:hypothetical protein HJFPF1_05645 [Paramyrothecium foliicola]|nr:hypothetical protein HJFPF1_05645 [Paramyrothecium foliicola]